MCATSANTPMLKPSKPTCVAKPNAASTIACLVCCPFCDTRPTDERAEEGAEDRGRLAEGRVRGMGAML
ncbi:hypothetical protein [Undibacterium sp.]|uniref:hypothetical protein n=1 Tax=Undibacterium sp. TaxID=1914977 RepID=UPI00272ACFA6|nr:hypothetical protein [Undibacterium sp.]